MLEVFNSLLPFFLGLIIIKKAVGQGSRADVEPETELRNGFAPTSANAEGACGGCSGSVVAAVIITALIFILLGTIWWYFKGRKLTRQVKTDPEALGRAAYDNPQFQYDDIDDTHEDQTRITIEPRTPVKAATQCVSTATNTTSTLERGKSTLERVMAAILRGSRSDYSKKTKDDSFIDERDVLVPLTSHDFAGLGFTVHGNLREGLYVKDVLNSGPASQSGHVISGDRIIALTIITEHIVFKDALTILSYASPYPVLLHLKKKRTPLSGSFSSSSSSFSFKGKQNSQQGQGGPSRLSHPAFRSQSHTDLLKVGEIDGTRLHMGNIMTPLGKSPGISQKLFKMARIEQKKYESRHSERAIDVPGVKVQISPNETDTVNIEDKMELANVQVHRPMSSISNVSLQQSSIELPTFQDSNLSETRDNLKNIEVEVEKDKPNPKTKFGVKVFPDLSFPKAKKQSYESDLESDMKNKNFPEIDPPVSKLTFEHESEAQNEENSQIELKVGVSSNALHEKNIVTENKSCADDYVEDLKLSPIGYSIDSQKVEHLTMPLTEDKHEKKNFESNNSDSFFVSEISSDSDKFSDKNKEKEMFIDAKSTFTASAKNKSFQTSPDLDVNNSTKSKSFAKNVEKSVDLQKKNASSDTDYNSDNDSNSISDIEISSKDIKISSINIPPFGFKRNINTNDSDTDSSEVTKLRSDEDKRKFLELKTKKESFGEEELNEDFKLDIHLKKNENNSTNCITKMVETNVYSIKTGKNDEESFLYMNDENNCQTEMSSLLKVKTEKHINADKNTKENSFDSVSESDNENKKHDDFNNEIVNTNTSPLNRKLDTDSSQSAIERESDKGLRQDMHTLSINLEAKKNYDLDFFSDDITSGIRIIDSSKSDDEAIKRKSKSVQQIIPDFDETFEQKSNSTEGLHIPGKASVEGDSNSENNCIRDSELESTKQSNVSMPDMILSSLYNKIEMDATDVMNEHLQLSVKNDSESSEADKVVENIDYIENNGKNVDPEIDLNTRTNALRTSLSLNANFDTRANNADGKAEYEHKPLRRLFSDFENDKTKNEKKKNKEKTSFNFKFKGPEFLLPTFGNKQEKQTKEKIFLKSDHAEVDENDTEFRIKNESFDKYKVEIDPEKNLQSSSLSYSNEINTNEDSSDFKIPALNLEQYNKKLLAEIPKLNLSNKSTFHKPETNILIDDDHLPIPLSNDMSNTNVELKAKTKVNFTENDVNRNYPEIKTNENINMEYYTEKNHKDFEDKSEAYTIPTVSKVVCELSDKEGTCFKNINCNLGEHTFKDNLPKEETDLCVQLPRVKMNSRSVDVVNDIVSDLADDKKSPSGVKLPKILKKSAESEIDEWKMKYENKPVSTNSVSLLREKFNLKLKEQDTNKSKNKIDIDLKRSEIRESKHNVNSDEQDFLIPNLKLESEYNSLAFSPENFSIQNLNIGESADLTESLEKSLDYELNWKQKQIDLLNVESKSSKIPPLSTNSTTDANVSLDSSSVENESDLPEADSDYKKISSGFMMDVPIPKLSLIKMNLEKSFNKDNEVSFSKPDILQTNSQDKELDGFGNAFGFRGFKKHVDSGEKSDCEEKNRFFSDNVSCENKSVQKDVKFNNSFEELKDELKNLPEADYDIDNKIKSFSYSQTSVDIKKSSVDLPEGDQENNYSIEKNLKSLGKSCNIKPCKTKNDLEDLKQTKLLDSNFESMAETKKEDSHKGKRDDDDDKTKSKIKLGLGFPFFGKSSDSEDMETENKILKEPDGITTENAEKYKIKTKKTFSFKGFGKSSSDTEEENSGKVSDMPMEKFEINDKETFRNSANAGAKSKGHKNSDSEDNFESGKTSSNYQCDVNLKKTKMKNNLTFGFINKYKAPSDMENAYHPESIGDTNEEHYSPENEDLKRKSKGKINLSIKGTKEGKYDTRSESEGGEDDKINMDSKGDDIKGKSKYGIGFGFKKSYGKNSSDSEGGDIDEQKVHLDERGNGEKGKEPKIKSIKLGFKGFKNLKGKIQTEINKMRHESPSSDEGENVDTQNFNEKRKKVTKKKDKEKKLKREPDKYLDPTEEATLSSAAFAAKDNRRKKHERKSTSLTSSSSSSSESSSENEGKPVEQKKKKKSKLKRKDEAKIVSNNADASSFTCSAITSEEDKKTPQIFKIKDDYGQRDSFSKSHVTVVMSEPRFETQENASLSNQCMDTQDDLHNYVVVREMKLKENTSDFMSSTLSQPFTLQKSTSIVQDQENEGVWGSDSDMEKGKQIDTEINSSSASIAINTSGKQRVLTDSEELKRRAASLGDLSRLHEGMLTGTLLERAVSLDLKNASVGPPSLHVRRLQLPDSSATSIDETDESTALQSPKKPEIGGFLKSASQWGTLEEAMILGVDGKYKQITLEPKRLSPVLIESLHVKANSTEGAQISNIEISGEKGSSITALSAEGVKWDDSFEDDEIPLLPSSPIPVERTTITVMEENGRSDSNEYSGSDSNIVVVGSELSQAINNDNNFNFNLHSSKISSSETHLVSHHHGIVSSSNTSINSDSGRHSPRPISHVENDVGGVTITMVPAESHTNTHVKSRDNNISLSSKTTNLTSATSQDLSQNENTQYSSLVTVSHDLLQNNGEIITEVTEHNISDEFITPDSTPQKSKTQITLDSEGVSGFTVMEGGAFSRTVIISSPELDASVNIVQAQENSELSS